MIDVKSIVGGLLAVAGMGTMAVCGIGIPVCLIAWVFSLLGAPFIAGAGVLFFKFLGAWLLGAFAMGAGYTLLN